MSDSGNYEKGVRHGDGHSPLFLINILMEVIKYSIMMLLIQSDLNLQT